MELHAVAARRKDVARHMFLHLDAQDLGPADRPASDKKARTERARHDGRFEKRASRENSTDGLAQ
ncbi:hypothetical protein EAO68_38105 [Streptomyces sp. wa22]|nr:hypothetical protein EAO68_38105 [Streptomyces sp. wa22]